MKSSNSIFKNFGISIWLITAILVVFSAFATTAKANSGNGIIVGVQHASTDLADGALHAYSQGFRHINIWLSPNPSNYPDTPKPQVNSLLELIMTSPYQQVLNMGFEEITITAYTYTGWNWITTGSDTLPQSVIDGVKSEMINLVAYLAWNYPNQSFKIKNWEGDWHLVPNYQAFAPVSQAKLNAIKGWMQARSDGFYLGQTIAGVNNSSFGIEFNLTDRGPAGLKNVLNDIVPYVQSDFVAYSAWESLTLNPSVIENDIKTRIQRIRSVTSLPVYVSEFGFYDPATAQNYTTLALQAFKSENIAEAHYWEMTGETWGLIKPNGNHHTALPALQAEMPSGGPPSASGHHVAFTRYWGIAGDDVYIEIFGDFNVGSTVNLVCDGVSTPNTIVYQSANQYNIRINADVDDRACDLSLTFGTSTTNEATAYVPGTLPRIIYYARQVGVWQGWDYSEMYGFFPANAQIQLTCNGVPTASTIVYSSTGQINFRTLPSSQDRDCNVFIKDSSGQRISQSFSYSINGQ